MELLLREMGYYDVTEVSSGLYRLRTSITCTLQEILLR
jgi:hypothetical protein